MRYPKSFQSGRVKTMLRIGSTVLLVLSPMLLHAQTAVQQPKKFHVVLSQEQKQHVLDGDFAIKRTVAELPSSVQSELASLFGESVLRMANPGERYQESDVIESGPRLPWRRLVFAGISEDRCFVHYERGGRAHGYYVLIIQLSPHGNGVSATPIWGGAGTARADDLKQLRDAVANGRLADDREYSW